MRIAWIGPMPNETGGATEVATQVLDELAAYRVQVDCFFPGPRMAVPERLTAHSNLRFFCQESNWQWGRWYSRNRLLCFITGQVANYRSEDKLAFQLLECHKKQPYDLVYQFSHIELSVLRKFVRELPPIVLHPSVHAAGELKWMRRESHISKSTETMVRRLGARLLLQIRSLVQKRHIRYPAHVIALSKTFGQELVEDYRIPTNKLTVIPNPIQTERFSPGAWRSSANGGRLRFLFVSRIAVRKGVEMMVELSHRLQDISDQIQIQIIGDKSLWSDYTPLLSQLNPDVAMYRGKVRAADMVNLYRTSHALIQPSHYEPFGLTVGEALATGIPVIASDKVGAAEQVSSECCRLFKSGDIDALEVQVRNLVRELQNIERRDGISQCARNEAVRLFSCSTVTGSIVECLSRIVYADREQVPHLEGLAVKVPPVSSSISTGTPTS